MKRFDIEAYLEGSLSQEAQAAFEQELRQNPAFAQQVEAQRKAIQLLRRQLLRERVTTALAEEPVRRKTRRWWWALVGTLLILLAGYFFILRKKPGNPLPANQETVPPDTARENEKILNVPSQEGKTIEDKKAPDQPQPVAENKPSGLLPPAYPSPNVRGQNDGNEAWKALLDKVWYTQLPPGAARFGTSYADIVKALSEREFEGAFVQLEMLESTLPESDTLRLLKGFCLLEMGEGSDALRYFSKLEDKQPGWKAWLEWHRGLALLLMGEVRKAAPEFRKIAKEKNHPFQRQSQKALDILE